MPAYIDESEIVDMVRYSGIPDDITDAYLTYIIKAALVRYSKFRPLMGMTYIPVKMDVQDYVLADSFTATGGDLTVLGVHWLLYSPGGFTTMPTLYGLPPNWWRMDSGEFYVFDQPSLGYVWMADFKHMSEMFQGTWETYEKSDGKSYLRLIPLPKTDYHLPIMYSLLRTTSWIREDDREEFSLCCQIGAYRAVAGNVGTAQSFTDTGLTIEMGSAIERYQELSAAAEARLQALAGNFAVVVRSG